MTITATDVKLLASERFTDDADGGGFMTATVITDGVENNVFPDISDVERALGNNSFRKVYGAVLVATSEQYRSAHVILDTIPADPNVSAILVQSRGVAQERAAVINSVTPVIQDLNQGTAGGYFSTKPLSVAAAAGDHQVKVNGLGVSLVPTSKVPSATSGPVVSGSSSLSACLVPIGASLPVELVLSKPTFAEFAMPGSVSGTCDFPGSSGVVLTNPDLSLVGSNGSSAPMLLGSNTFPGKGSVTFTASGGTSLPTAIAATYTPAASLSLPVDIYELTWAVGMDQTQFITLPYPSEVGSESITYRAEGFPIDSVFYTNGSTNFQNGGSFLSATVNRTTKVVSIVFGIPPKVGTKVQIRFVRAGYAQSLSGASLGASFASSQLHVNVSSGFSLKYARFSISTDAGVTYRLEGGTIYRFGAVVGSFNATTGMLQMLVPDGTTVSDWRAVEVSDSMPALAVSDGLIPAGLDPDSVTIAGNKVAGGTFSANAAADGSFATAMVTGTYDTITGKLVLAFSEAVAIAGLTYAADQFSYTPVTAAQAGVNPSAFPVNGEVPVFREGDLVIVHNTQALAPQTVTNGQTVNVGRTNLSEVRVIGSNGAEIFTGWAVDKATGVVTFSAVAGYSQPVTISHRIEDIRRAISVTVDGKINLSNALSHDFTSGTSYVSSALLLGDMFARAHEGFQLATWANVWADLTSGLAILADYNEAAHPVSVRNDGAITERWALVFTTTTTFTVTGEQVGMVAVGNTATDCAPVNPATGAPYFTIPAAGWGSGWAQGNAYRFNTTGASSPFWAIRSIKPSIPTGADRITLALRGSVNA